MRMANLDVESDKLVTKLFESNQTRSACYVEMECDLLEQEKIYSDIEQRAHSSGTEKHQEITRMVGEITPLRDQIATLEVSIYISKFFSDSIIKSVLTI